MSVQKKEKATWEMLDRFFLRVLREKEGTAVMAESREQAATFLAGSQETSPSRRALMQSTILPRVAVYTVLKHRGLDAEKLMEKYVREVQGPAPMTGTPVWNGFPVSSRYFAGPSGKRPPPATLGSAPLRNSRRNLT